MFLFPTPLPYNLQAFLSLVEQYIESKDLKKQLQHMKKKIKQLGESNDRAILTMSQLKREVRDKNKAAKGKFICDIENIVIIFW